MAEKNGFIAIDRNINTWRWYTDANTMRVWIHILTNCNYKKNEFKNTVINPGQMFTSYEHIAEALKITISQARTSISHMRETGEIACENAHYGILITVLNWEKYNIPKKTSQAGTQDENKNVAGYSQAVTQANRNNITNKQYINKNTDDDYIGDLKKIFSVGFEKEPDEDDLDILNQLIQEAGYAKVLEALKKTRKHNGQEITYTKQIIQKRKSKAKPFDPDREIEKILEIIATETKEKGIPGSGMMTAAFEMKKYYTDEEMYLALRECSAYDTFDPDSFRNELRTNEMQRRDV